MRNKKVYLLFSDTGSLLTKCINLYTKTTLNHASIAFDLELTEVYSFGRKRPHNPFIGGFVRENLQTKIFHKARCAVYSFTITEADYDQMLYRIKEMEKHRHEYRYNFIGLFGVALNKELERKNAYFCSQFIATILSECGIYQNSKPSCLTKPQDLMDWHQLQLVYQGELSKYPFLSHEESTNKIIQSYEKVVG
ncbi:hypothetical protein NC661_10730 [Aquibacillus koreensis]|uniref:Permuted papain-like amidase enzyme, YaeF/YiiX, C92 family n=1 Tax=Aquibacillus koreensis TaxID=279446 RepID=A0A9X3WP78_9BACI|nr:hypothetical protein [Aquibacillus koreensis]MCT2538212.1 hypothetical protein [Aquibacillus koreensis]MDC3420844.1 hypothetical protein [Aquibacillus koreensis]